MALRTDFHGRLLALGDALVEIKSVCFCRRKPTMTLRVNETGGAVAEGRLTEIGGDDRYVAPCRRHFVDALASRTPTP